MAVSADCERKVASFATDSSGWPGGGSIGIPGSTVFALGADDHYIVVKQYPAKDSFGDFDQTVTDYFHPNEHRA